MDFKEGDKVRCVDTSDAGTTLQKRIYVVDRVRKAPSDGRCILDLKGVYLRGWNATRFTKAVSSNEESKKRFAKMRASLKEKV